MISFFHFVIPTAHVVNECLEGLHNCHLYAECIDTPGYFECSCLPGHTGDGVDRCNGEVTILQA